jgi:heme/copper-type cytochrome/quinol oxidase subunit 2
MALLFLSTMTVTNVQARMLAAQPATDNNALELLVIELFFLFVGLVVLAFLVYLLWQSRRNKKKAKEKGK